MKYLQTYKIFENQDSDDVVTKGHKWSKTHIEEVLLYLTDIGFNWENWSEYFVDESGVKCELADAEKSLVQLNLMKPINSSNLIKRSGTTMQNGYRTTITHYFTKWGPGDLEMQEAISSFCQRFENCYYHLSLEEKGWVLNFEIQSDVEEEVRTKQKQDNIIHKVEVDISDRISRIYRGLFDSFNRTTYSKVRVNKLGETMWSPQGSIEKGCLLVPVNTTSSLPKTVRMTIMPEVNDRCRIFNNFLRGSGKAEVVTITEEVIDDLVKSVGGKVTKQYYVERYLGLTGIIMKFDYSKLFDAIKKETNQ
jgi:hypothetical protein